MSIIINWSLLPIKIFLFSIEYLRYSGEDSQEIKKTVGYLGQDVSSYESSYVTCQLWPIDMPKNVDEEADKTQQG